VDALLRADWRAIPDLEALLARFRLAVWHLPSLEEIKLKSIEPDEFNKIRSEIEEKLEVTKNQLDEKTLYGYIVGMVRGVIAGYSNAPRRLAQLLAKASNNFADHKVDWELHVALLLRGVALGDTKSAVVAAKTLQEIVSTKTDERVKFFLDRCLQLPNWTRLTSARAFKELVTKYYGTSV
jgi:hypothetical protein